MNAKTAKILKTTADVLLWIFLAFALLMTIFAFSAQASGNGYPKFGNTCLFMVESDSMEGPDGFYTGDLIVGKVLTQEEKQNLQVGDVISFYLDITPSNGIDDKVLNTHRIVEIIPGTSPENVTYRTKGDHNTSADGYTISTDVIEAKWTGKHIAGIGAFISFLQSSDGFLLCVVLPLAIFFIYELIYVVLSIIKIKNKGKKMITKEDEELIKQRAIAEFLASQAAQSQEAPQTTQEESSSDNKEE